MIFWKKILAIDELSRPPDNKILFFTSLRILNLTEFFNNSIMSPSSLCLNFSNSELNEYHSFNFKFPLELIDIDTTFNEKFDNRIKVSFE